MTTSIRVPATLCSLKTILLLLTIFVCSPNAWAQSDAYSRFKTKVLADGWTFATEYHTYQLKGELGDRNFTLIRDRDYKIFCMSPSGEVTDLDNWVYDNKYSNLLDKDVDKAELAIVTINSGSGGTINVKFKIISASSSTTPYKCQVLLVYKAEEDEDDEDDDPYGFSSLRTFTDTLNNNMAYARMHTGKILYPFSVFGKTDFDRRSVQFFIKNGELYIRMNIPREGSCDYGLKEVKAKYTSARGTSYIGNKPIFYLQFEFSYTCQNDTYSGISIFFNNLSEEFYEALPVKLKECCK